MWNPFKLIKKPFSWAWNKAKKKLAMMLIKRLIKELSMSGFWNTIKGYKTYILSTFAIIGAIGNIISKLFQGEPVTMEDIMMLLGAFGLGTLRAGMNK